MTDAGQCISKNRLIWLTVLVLENSNSMRPVFDGGSLVASYQTKK
jgi:hypothetical protein